VLLVRIPLSLSLTLLSCTHIYLTRVLGFDYEFHAIQNESNELFSAYKEMFEIAISQGDGLSTFVSIYAPWVYKLFVSWRLHFQTIETDVIS
jgi:hypothetical protein